MTPIEVIIVRATSEDPAVALPALAELARWQSRAERIAANTARASGWSWERIAAALGRSKQAVWERYSAQMKRSEEEDRDPAAEWEQLATAFSNHEVSRRIPADVRDEILRSPDLATAIEVLRLRRSE